VARRTRVIIIQNMTWAGLYNGLVLPFAALGWVTPLWAALGMSVSSLLVVLNALRLSNTATSGKPQAASTGNTCLETR
jgi:Cu2+-exporting ATPase